MSPVVSSFGENTVFDDNDSADPAQPLVGRPRCRPEAVVCDRGYDHNSHRRLVRARGVTPILAHRKTEHGSCLGTVRWVVERTLAHLHQSKRLLVRYERRADMHEAMLALGCCLVCFRRLEGSF